MSTFVNHKRWYAIQPFYRRYTAIHNVLDRRRVGYIHPYRFDVVRTENEEPASASSQGRQYGIYGLKLRPSLVIQLVFVYADKLEIEAVRQEIYEQGRVLSSTTTDLWTPLVIPDEQLLEFLKVLSLNADYRLIDDRPGVFAKGETVRVIAGGMYDGLEGVVCRIKHNRHLIVRIEGVCAVATDYVPQQYLVRKSAPAYNKDSKCMPSMKVAELAYNLRLLYALARQNDFDTALVAAVRAILLEVCGLIDTIRHLDTRLDISRERLDAMLTGLVPCEQQNPDSDYVLPDLCRRTSLLCDEIRQHFAAQQL